MRPPSRQCGFLMLPAWPSGANRRRSRPGDLSEEVNAGERWFAAPAHGTGHAACATDWLWATYWWTHSPVICRVAALMRLKALMAAIATTSPASCNSS